MTIVFLLCTWVSISSSAENFMLLANPSVKLDVLSAEMVRKLYLGELTQIEAAQRVRLSYSNHDAKAVDEFMHRYLDMNSDAFGQKWRILLFSGRAIPPKKFDSQDDLINFLRNNTGAIAFVPSNAVLPTGVKKIEIIDANPAAH